MSDAPDRIWADAPSLFDGTDLWHTSRETAEKTATEYVRADIFSAKDAENARLRNLIGRYGMCVGDAEGVDFADGDHLTEDETEEVRAMIDAAELTGGSVR